MDSSGLSLQGTLISISAVLHHPPVTLSLSQITTAGIKFIILENLTDLAYMFFEKVLTINKVGFLSLFVGCCFLPQVS